MIFFVSYIKKETNGSWCRGRAAFNQNIFTQVKVRLYFVNSVKQLELEHGTEWMTIKDP